jgi:lipoate---protein ligase
MNESLIFKSDSFDPWHNLAVEEILLDMVGENQYILYLWQNRDTVVIGKNQNPWKECRAGLLEQDGGYLARRLSGGGTVFHDLGNLNFTFLMSRANYNLEKQTAGVLAAVKKLGIAAEMNSRNDLTLDGCKFSGNAFCFRKNNAYHHGTLLIASDFEKLAKYLQVSKENIRSKGIESVRTRVVNLTEYRPSLTIEMMMDALCQEFTKIYGGDPGGSSLNVKSTDSLDQSAIQKLYQKYASWEWRYGETPKFALEIATRLTWGEIKIGLQLENGIIHEAFVYSEALDEAFIGMLAQTLRGVIFSGPVMAEGILNMNIGKERLQMQNDIADWLKLKDF